MENLINNCKFYVKLKKSRTDKHNTAFTYNNSLNTDELIYTSKKQPVRRVMVGLLLKRWLFSTI